MINQPTVNTSREIVVDFRNITERSLSFRWNGNYPEVPFAVTSWDDTETIKVYFSKAQADELYEEIVSHYKALELAQEHDAVEAGYAALVKSGVADSVESLKQILDDIKQKREQDYNDELAVNG